MRTNLEKWNIEKEKILLEFLPVLKEMPHKLKVMQMFLSQLASWFFYMDKFTPHEILKVRNNANSVEKYLKDLYQELTSDDLGNYFPERIFSFVDFFFRAKKCILARFKEVDEFIQLANELVVYGNKLVLDPSLKEYEFDDKGLSRKFDLCLTSIDYFLWYYGNVFYSNGDYFSEREDKGKDKWGESKKEQTDDK